MDEAFGRYRLLSLIGEGAMGKVYKAHDTMMDRDVAIKILPTDLANEPGYRERFRREARTAARLTEQHVIPIYEAGEIDGRLYLVMPIIDGIDLQSLLHRDRFLPPERAVKVIEQLAAALDAAHAAGLVHRDVKPSNALITGRDNVYLIDFGIAHDAAATKLTRTGTTMGTWAYMAPERFTTGTADARADVYALACVLYESLTGQLPYPGDSMPQQYHGHLSVDPPKPTAVNAAIPRGFDDVIARGMAKAPDKRYQTAPELADAAHHALTEAPTTARNPHTAPTRRADPARPVAAPRRPEPRPEGALPIQPGTRRSPQRITAGVLLLGLAGLAGIIGFWGIIGFFGQIIGPAFATAGVLVFLRYPRRAYWTVAIAGVSGSFVRPGIVWLFDTLYRYFPGNAAWLAASFAVCAVVTAICVLIARWISKKHSQNFVSH